MRVVDGLCHSHLCAGEGSLCLYFKSKCSPLVPVVRLFLNIEKTLRWQYV